MLNYNSKYKKGEKFEEYGKERVSDTQALVLNPFWKGTVGKGGQRAEAKKGFKKNQLAGRLVGEAACLVTHRTGFSSYAHRLFIMATDKRI